MECQDMIETASNLSQSNNDRYPKIAYFNLKAHLDIYNILENGRVDPRVQVSKDKSDLLQLTAFSEEELIEKTNLVLAKYEDFLKCIREIHNEYVSKRNKESTE